MHDDDPTFNAMFDDDPEDGVAVDETAGFAPLLAELAGLGMEVARSVRALAGAQAALAQMAVTATREAMAQAAEGVAGADAPGGSDAAARDAEARPDVGLALAALQRLAALGDMGLSFSRVSRSVRLTVAMDAQLKLGPEAFAPPRARARADHSGAAAAKGEEDETSSSNGEYILETGWRKAEIDLLVERAIETGAPESEHPRLLSEMCERIHTLDADEGFLDRPFAEVVLQLCRDLGLDPDPAIWEQPDFDPPDPSRSTRAIRQRRGPGRPHWAPMVKHRLGFYPGSIWATVAPRVLQRRRELLDRVAQAKAPSAAVWTPRRASAP